MIFFLDTKFKELLTGKDLLNDVARAPPTYHPEIALSKGHRETTVLSSSNKDLKSQRNTEMQPNL